MSQRYPSLYLQQKTSGVLYANTLTQRQAISASKGISIPSADRFVPADLGGSAAQAVGTQFIPLQQQSTIVNTPFR